MLQVSIYYKVPNWLMLKVYIVVVVVVDKLEYCILHRIGIPFSILLSWDTVLLKL